MTKPNLILLLTDQQHTPRQWPDDPAWLANLLPAEAELRRTALSFTRGYCASSMCSPSRATMMTSRWPAEHGVELTLTHALPGEAKPGGWRPQPQHAPDTLGKVIRNQELPASYRARMVATNLMRRPDGGDLQRPLDPSLPSLARVLERAGYTTTLKGKWHLTNPLGGGEWTERDSEHLERVYGLHGWVPPDAGENTDHRNFGGGNAGRSHEGWDEDFIRQTEEFLADPPPEPWALIVSLVNPHDVLGYPGTYAQGGFRPSEWADLTDIGLPETIDEDLSRKPTGHALMALSMGSVLGPLNTREQQLDYVRFYAHLQRLVDTKVARLLKALGDADDPTSLRSKTVILRTSDHGEMGLAHGGIRQKAFNAYDETLNVPFVVSNPTLFPTAMETDAPACLADILPTLAGIAGVDTREDDLRGEDLRPVLAHHARPERERLDATGVDLSTVAEHPAPSPSVQDAIHFTFDDHSSGSAFNDVQPPPNRLRTIRTMDAMYTVYVDPLGRAAPQFEMYDTERDPLQVDNLVDRDTGVARSPSDAPMRRELHERLVQMMDERRTTPPPAAGLPAA